MKAEKIVWCQKKNCPHVIDGQCFADEVKLKIMTKEYVTDKELYCKTFFENVSVTSPSYTPV